MKCPNCFPKGLSFNKYHDKHDSYYCGICYEWLESACDDPDCWFCPGRPDTAYDEEN